MEDSNDILKSLLDLTDSKNAIFQRRLTPGPNPDSFLGVRVPDLRKLAKTIAGTEKAERFLSELPHKFFDENMLHAILISEIKDYAGSTMKVEAFLPYVDNWAVCDSLSPRAFKKNKKDVMCRIGKWTASGSTYAIRFGIGTLMRHFLDDDFKSEYLELPASIVSDEYYVNMMVAWFFATALAKQWNAAVKILESKRLPAWTHNKTIQKACESFRIANEQKDYLKTLRLPFQKQSDKIFTLWHEK